MTMPHFPCGAPGLRTVMAPRPPLLAALLRRRATAAAAGLDDLEAMLRDQILGSLPVQAGSALGDRPAIRPQREVPAPAPPVARAAVDAALAGVQRGGSAPVARPTFAATRSEATTGDRARGLALFRL